MSSVGPYRTALITVGEKQSKPRAVNSRARIRSWRCFVRNTYHVFPELPRPRTSTELPRTKLIKFPIVEPRLEEGNAQQPACRQRNRCATCPSDVEAADGSKRQTLHALATA